MEEQVDIQEAINQLTSVDLKVIFGALEMCDNQQEPVNEVKTEMNETAPQPESSTPAAAQSNEDINVDDLLDCLNETYKELYGDSAADNPTPSPIQQQNVQAPSEYTGQTSVGVLPTQYAEMTIVPQVPSHWPTLYSLPNNAENAEFVAPQIYKCNYCRKQCLSRAALTRHINNYHAKRHLRCWDCGFFPISGEYLLRHDFYNHSHSRRYFYNVSTF